MTVKAFWHELSQGWNVDPELSAADQKTAIGMNIVQFSLGSRSLGLSLQHGKSWPQFYGMQNASFCYTLWDVVKPPTRTHTFKPIKPCSSLSGKRDRIKIFLKSHFNSTPHDHTQVWKHRKQSQGPSSHIAQRSSLSHKFSHLWSTQRCHPKKKGLGVTTSYWRSEFMALSTQFKEVD